MREAHAHTREARVQVKINLRKFDAHAQCKLACKRVYLPQILTVFYQILTKCPQPDFQRKIARSAKITRAKRVYTELVAHAQCKLVRKRLYLAQILTDLYQILT